MADGNIINYPGDCGTTTTNILTMKLLFNNVISTLGARFMTINIKKLSQNSNGEIRTNLCDISTKDGYVYVK